MRHTNATQALNTAIANDDESAFDEAVRALSATTSLSRALVETLDAEQRARLLARMPPRNARRGSGLIDVPSIAPLGRPGFWMTARWALETIPGRERYAPTPSFERWDALVEIHRAHPEAAWLVLELFVALVPHQRALGRRALLGYRRRFGKRGRDLAGWTLRSRSVPLADILRHVVEP